MVGLNLSLIDRRGTSKALFALLLAAFHTANHFLFVLETFPWVMMSAFAVHFDSSWMDGFARSGTYNTVGAAGRDPVVVTLARSDSAEAVAVAGQPAAGVSAGGGAAAVRCALVQRERLAHVGVTVPVLELENDVTKHACAAGGAADEEQGRR